MSGVFRALPPRSCRWALEEFRPLAASGRGGMMARGYVAKFTKKGLRISVFQMPDGKIEQYLITGAE